MAKRRIKKRTHQVPDPADVAKIPKSMVLALGTTLKNHSLAQLVKDFRLIMQPHTAINLRERKANKLKDYVVMTGPLGVSDIFAFKQSDSGNVSLRIGKMPRGPSLQFKVNTYSLMKDVNRTIRRPQSVSRDSAVFLQPPLLVMNGFASKVSEMSNHDKLVVTVFQNLFPPIKPHETRVGSIKRVLLLNRDAEGNIDVRHYAISTKLVEENRSIKKLVGAHHSKRKLPVMTQHADISDLVLDPYAAGVTSESEVEDDAVVEIQNEARTVRKPEAQSSTRKRAIKLTELGPRLNMLLVKILESMVGSSRTIYHAHVSKTSAEEKELEKVHDARNQQKAERRAEQKANVEAKRAKKQAKKARREQRKNGTVEGEENENEEEEEEDEDEDSGPEINPSDYENDSDLFSD